MAWSKKRTVLWGCGGMDKLAASEPE